MKKLILIWVILVPTIIMSQFRPVIGLKYTGGLSYDMEHEYFSGQLGLMYHFDDNSRFQDIMVSGEYVYDYMKEFTGKQNIYILRLQTSNSMNTFIEKVLDWMCILGLHNFEYGRTVVNGNDDFGRKYQINLESRKCKHCEIEQVLKGHMFDNSLKWKTIQND